VAALTTIPAVRRLLPVALALVLAGCGGSKHASEPTTTAPSMLAVAGRVLYQGSDRAVALDGTKATAYRLVGDSWHADRSDEPQIDILGPKPGATVQPITQFAFQVTAKTDLVDTAMWVDGVEVPGKGGGLTPKKGTIYGAPTKALRRGRHVAVAYASTATHATAVAWVFHV
jgi:hypothetical protein